MPDDTKKNRSKNKNDPKEQRKKRQNRHQVASTEKNDEIKTERSKVPILEKTAPTVNEPPPEFYKNLKRETDEILKITEEESSKYKKKEIQSNWAKYEMPIETYDEIEEQESSGADYQALIDASLSIGGHFQFKHEKSWDIITGSSPYDKYFEVNMDALNLALCSIPFYQRNNLDVSLFIETDIQTMNNRSVKYKQKYYNDKKFTTVELDAQDKLLKILQNSDENGYISEQKEENSDETQLLQLTEDINLSDKDAAVNEVNKYNTEPEIENKAQGKEEKKKIHIVDVNDKSDDECEKEVFNMIHNRLLENVNIVSNRETVQKLFHNDEQIQQMITEDVKTKVPEPVEDRAKKPAIESPEDLEKWLDDFLDG